MIRRQIPNKIILFVLFLIASMTAASCGGSDGGGGGSSCTSSSMCLYDDFSDNSIDVSKWNPSATNGSVSEAGGEIVLSVDNTGSVGVDSRAQISFTSPSTIKAIQADFTVTNYLQTTADVKTRIMGSFYNDNNSGTATSGSFQDDILIHIVIQNWVSYYAVFRCEDSTCSSNTTLVSGNLATGLSSGTKYTLYAAWDGATTFTFIFNSGTNQILDVGGAAPYSGPSMVSFKKLEARINNSGTGTIDSHIDNAYYADN